MLALNVEWLGMGQLHTKDYGHYRMNQLNQLDQLDPSKCTLVFPKGNYRAETPVYTGSPGSERACCVASLIRKSYATCTAVNLANQVNQVKTLYPGPNCTDFEPATPCFVHPAEGANNELFVPRGTRSGVGHIVQNPSVQGVRRLSGQARGSVTTIIAGNVFLRRPGP